MQPRWKDPMSTPEGELLQSVKQIEASVVKQTQKAGMCKNDMCKNMNCMGGCGKSDDKGNYMEKASMDEKNAYCQKTFSCNYSECTPEQKARCDKHCGNLSKEDATIRFLREKGIVVKYEQEPNIENNVPTFMDHSGGIPVEAINYHTNQTMPFYTDKAPKSTFISEKAQIPSVAQTGYDEKSSSLHMHLNDKGGSYQWTAPITDAMMSLKKSGVGNPGIVEQIAQQVEQLVGRLS